MSTRQWTEKGACSFRDFNIIGSHGRPLVTLSFETQAEAEAAQKAMLPVVRTAKLTHPEEGAAEKLNGPTGIDTAPDFLLTRPAVRSRLFLIGLIAARSASSS